MAQAPSLGGDTVSTVTAVATDTNCPRSVPTIAAVPAGATEGTTGAVCTGGTFAGWASSGCSATPTGTCAQTVTRTVATIAAVPAVGSYPYRPRTSGAAPATASAWRPACASGSHWSCRATVTTGTTIESCRVAIGA